MPHPTVTARRFYHCVLVVVSIIFGAQDVVWPTTASGSTTCFIMFLDEATMRVNAPQTKYVAETDATWLNGWQVVQVSGMPWADPRVNTRYVKLLLPYHFPHARWCVSDCCCSHITLPHARWCVSDGCCSHITLPYARWCVSDITGRGGDAGNRGGGGYWRGQSFFWGGIPGISDGMNE